MRMVKEIEEINKKFEDQLKKKGENLQKVLKQMEAEFLKEYTQKQQQLYKVIY